MNTSIFRRISLLALAILATSIISSCGTCSCKKEKKVITGQFAWDEWQDQAGWDTYEAEGYAPEPEFIGIVADKGGSDEISYLLFGAAWCHDSETQIPMIYTMFEIAGIPFEKITLFGLDRDKLEPSGKSIEYNIKRVPTLVILRNGEEIGRIVEFPETSWEEGIAKILSL